jgi:hypothetical protein
MPKEVATAIITATFTVMTLIIGAFIHSYFSSSTDMEYTLQMSSQLAPIASKFLPSTTLIDFIQTISEKTNIPNFDDKILASELIRNKDAIGLIKKIANFDCAGLITISNKSDLKATNVTIVGLTSEGMIADWPLDFGLAASVSSFSDVSVKKNIGDLLPSESMSYIILSKYHCSGIKSFGEPVYSVVHDKGVAYFEQFPETNDLVNLALRHQVVSYMLLSAGIYSIFILIAYLTTKIVSSIATGLRPPSPPAEVGGGKQSGTSKS